MYCYLYDEFIQENKRFERELLKIENRLTDLGIAGKVSRLALFRNAEDMIRDEIRRGVSTVVVLGNDDTIGKVVDAVADSDAVLGIIPIGPNNEFAKMIGVPEGVAACDILSARRVETIDAGVVNGRRFITGLNIPHFKAELTCEEQYRLTTQGKGAEVEIRNLTPFSNPCDGQLEVVIRTQVKKGWGLLQKKVPHETVLPLKNLVIRQGEPMELYVEGEKMSSTRFDVSVEPMKLKVITGKQRCF